MPPHTCTLPFRAPRLHAGTAPGAHAHAPSAPRTRAWRRPPAHAARGCPTPAHPPPPRPPPPLLPLCPFSSLPLTLISVTPVGFYTQFSTRAARTPPAYTALRATRRKRRTRGCAAFYHCTPLRAVTAYAHAALHTAPPPLLLHRFSLPHHRHFAGTRAPAGFLLPWVLLSTGMQRTDAPRITLYFLANTTATTALCNTRVVMSRGEKNASAYQYLVPTTFYTTHTTTRIYHYGDDALASAWCVDTWKKRRGKGCMLHCRLCCLTCPSSALLPPPPLFTASILSSKHMPHTILFTTLCTFCSCWPVSHTPALAPWPFST